MSTFSDLGYTSPDYDIASNTYRYVDTNGNIQAVTAEYVANHGFPPGVAVAWSNPTFKDTLTSREAYDLWHWQKTYPRPTEEQLENKSGATLSDLYRFISSALFDEVFADFLDHMRGEGIKDSALQSYADWWADEDNFLLGFYTVATNASRYAQSGYGVRKAFMQAFYNHFPFYKSTNITYVVVFNARVLLP